MKNARSVWKRRLPCDYRALSLVFVFLKSLDLCGVAVVVYKYLPRMAQEKQLRLNVLRAYGSTMVEV